MFRKLLAFLIGERACLISGSKAEHLPDCLHVFHDAEMDVEEVSQRLSAYVLAGIRKEIAKAKQVRPKVAVKKK